MKSNTPFFGLVVFCIAVTHLPAAASSQLEDRQLLGAYLAMPVGWVAGGYLGMHVYPKGILSKWGGSDRWRLNSPDAEAFVVGIPLGAATGATLASSICAYAIGRVDGEPGGSLTRTLLTAVIPPLVGGVTLGTFLGIPWVLTSGGELADVPRAFAMTFAWGMLFGSIVAPYQAVEGYHSDTLRMGLSLSF